LIAIGLKHNTEVIIEGYPDVYLVKDKMNSRYRNRIDVYMGLDIKRAKEWGQKKLNIRFEVPLDSTEIILK
jgi:3D (Asp-Asp-Asp) domain-containing protein